MTNQSQFRLTIGGDVQANNGTYLRRDVDDALLTACLNGDFAYVLACRQIGKSSLKNAVAEELIEQGVQVARVDLNRIGQNVNAQQWYYSLLTEIARELGLRRDFETWWENQPELSTHAQRFLTFFDQLVLPHSDAPVVIFLDEIDVTLGLPFTDDLFAAIRSVYNDRSQNDAYRRLSFVLLGVATPDDLINDSTRTPFNVGEPIPIQDFGYDEIAQTFIDLIEAQHPSHGQTYFDQIFSWTNGHPYLTQRLTRAVTDSADSPPNLVEQQVREIFLTEGERLESNLHTVQTRVLSDEHVVGMMRIHRRLLDGKEVADAQKSPAINRLKLYGLVTAEGGKLRIRNRIYEEVFDHEWNRKHFPINWSKRIAAMSIGVLVAFLLIGTGIFAHNNLWLPSIASQLDSKYSEAEETDDVHGQCVAMAGLYQLDERIIGPGSRYYASKAERHLARLNADKTIRLFDPPADACHATLIEQFHIELVDTELLANNLPTGKDLLLQAMATSQSLPEATPFADVELAAWANARNAVRNGVYQEAINAYSTAIVANEVNPGLFYERAVVFLEIQELDNALSDLSQLGQLLDFATPTPAPATPTPTPTLTPTATTTPMVTRPPSASTSDADRTPTSNAEPTLLDIADAEHAKEISENDSLEAPTIIATPRITGVIERTNGPRLLTELQRLLQSHPQFENTSNAQLQAYPTLVALGLEPLSFVTDPTSTFSLTATVTSAPIISTVVSASDSACVDNMIQRLEDAIVECSDINDGWACYGSRNVTAQPFNTRFENVRDRLPLSSIDIIQTDSDGMAFMNFGRLGDRSSIKAIVFGNNNLTIQDSDNLEFNLENDSSNTLCGETPPGILFSVDEGLDSRVTLNGVFIEIGGSTFVTVDNNEVLTIVNLTGDSRVSRDGVNVHNLGPGMQSQLDLRVQNFSQIASASLIGNSPILRALSTDFNSSSIQYIRNTNADILSEEACVGGISLNNSIADSIQHPGHECLYALCLNESAGLTVRMESGSSNLNPWLDIYDPNGRLIASNNDISASNTNSAICNVELPATSAQDGHCLMIAARSYRNLTMGDFTLLVEPGDSCASDEAGSIVVPNNSTPSLVLHATDQSLEPGNPALDRELCQQAITEYRAAIADCSDINDNWACLVSEPVDVEPIEYRFHQLRDRRPLGAFNSIDTSRGGIVLMNVRMAGYSEPLRLILAGNSVFALQDGQCTDTPPGMIIQTENGVRGTIQLNRVTIDQG